MEKIKDYFGKTFTSAQAGMWFDKTKWIDGRDLKDYNEDLQKAYKQIEEANGYVIGMPVYCYSVSGVLKNFLDINE